MKKAIFIVLLIVNVAAFSQVNNIVGDYKITLGNEDHLIEYKLVLNSDFTFFFHSFSNVKKGIPPKVNKYGKGTWTLEDNVVSFIVEKDKDFDEKHTLDFNNTKARFITKSPRDKTDRVIKTRLKFFKSEISWIKGIDIFKL